MHKSVIVTPNSSKFYTVSPYQVAKRCCLIKKCHLKQTSPSHWLKEKKRKEIDSLMDMRTKNKTRDLDEKIKILKSELTSLVGEGSKLHSGNNNAGSNAKYGCFENALSGIKQVHKTYEGKVSFSGGRVDVNLEHEKQKKMKANNHSDGNEFTKWLDLTIDSLNKTDKSKLNKRKHIPAPKNVILNTLDNDSDCIISDYETEADFDINRAGQELLFESFLIQNYPYYTPSTDIQDITEQAMNLNKRKHEKTGESRNRRAKKSKTCHKKGDKRKAKTLIVCESSDSEVEVINIDDDSNSSPPVNNKVDLKEDKPNALEIIEDERTSEKEKTATENSSSRKGAWECPICFEQNTGQAVVTTMCGHVFCKKCLDDYYITYSQICPTCRTDLHDKPVITLFNF